MTHEVSHQDTVTGMVYTCPLHPEVRLYKPGMCPKCGMTLVQSRKSIKGINNQILLIEN